jgi:hypothetical protein
MPKYSDFTLRITSKPLDEITTLLENYIGEHSILHIAYDADHQTYSKKDKKWIDKPHYHILIRAIELVDTVKLIKLIRETYPHLGKGNKYFGTKEIQELENALIYQHKKHHHIIHSSGISETDAQIYTDKSYDKKEDAKVWTNVWKNYIKNYDFNKKIEYENIYLNEHGTAIKEQCTRTPHKNDFYESCINFILDNGRSITHYNKSDMVNKLYKEKMLGINTMIEYYHLP